MEDFDFDDVIPKFLSNWSNDYLDDIDTSKYSFPNTIWHVKPATEISLKATAMIVVGITGIFLNSIVLIILISNKWLWSPSNYLIGNLAFIDLVTLMFCPWLMLVRDFYQNYVLRNFGCRFEGFLQACLLLASVIAVMLVSYDRLAAAALTSEARITKKAAPKLILANWLVAIALSTPWIVNREFMVRHWLDYVEMFCVEDLTILSIYWHFIVILLVWIPLGVMIVTVCIFETFLYAKWSICFSQNSVIYGTIMWRLEWTARELSSRGGGQSITRARGKAMRITACILLASAVCRIPYTILVYWRNNLNNEINSVKGGFEIMWFIASYLMYLNCAINPLIYGFTNLRFRRAMDRTPGIACFRFGSWCCICTTMVKKKQSIQQNDLEKIFVIESGTPQPKRKLSGLVKKFLHINRQSVELSLPKVDEGTTKPTKVTKLKVEQV